MVPKQELGNLVCTIPTYHFVVCKLNITDIFSKDDVNPDSRLLINPSNKNTIKL